MRSIHSTVLNHVSLAGFSSFQYPFVFQELFALLLLHLFFHRGSGRELTILLATKMSNHTFFLQHPLYHCDPFFL